MAIQAQLYSDNLGFIPIGSSQDLMMENNACGFNQFSFNPLQQQQENLLQIQQQQQLQILNQKNNQNLMNFCTSHKANSTQSVLFPQSLACQLEKQRLEIDQFITLQNERLRLALQEQRKQQMALILRNYESKAQVLLRQKDEEIAKAMNRSKELEDFLKRIEMESQIWQRMAKENEAIVLSLNNTIEQLRESGNGCAGDAESCCDVPPMENNVQQENEEQQTRKMMCKSCSCRKSCMVFLPCRHLSSCKDCDPFLHSCPVCHMVKKASIEALI